jgi:hypothetical protein
VQIHAVVDFRQAPSLANLTAAAAAPSASASASSSSGGTADPNALTSALQPSIGGQILYFQIE